MNDDALDAVRRMRPEVAPPSGEARRQAREALEEMIAREAAGGSPEQSVVELSAFSRTRPRAASVHVARARRARQLQRARLIRLTLAAASVAVVAGVGTLVTVGHQNDAPALQIAAGASPTQVLGTAARLVSATTDTDDADRIRHIRFRGLSDPGQPVYDRYVGPDGRARIAANGGVFTDERGYPTAAELKALPTDPTALRPALTEFVAAHDLAQPGEATERGLFRAAVMLLTDPGTPGDVKAGIYRVIQRFDLASIHARTVGVVRDQEGRRGIGLAFDFEEGLRETLVLDQSTGAVLSDTSVTADGQIFSGQEYLVMETVASIPTHAE